MSELLCVVCIVEDGRSRLSAAPAETILAGYAVCYRHISHVPATHLSYLGNRKSTDWVEAPEDAVVDRRHAECVENWPDCYTMGYDPRCCRFPKSCSCDV